MFWDVFLSVSSRNGFVERNACSIFSKIGIRESIDVLWFGDVGLDDSNIGISSFDSGPLEWLDTRGFFPVSLCWEELLTGGGESCFKILRV
jgi:hypothetical protein